MKRSLLLAALLAPMTLGSMTANAGDITGVASVIDGDTIEVHGTRIRLHGIDAPESAQLCIDADGKPWRCGQQASLALAELIGRTPVTCNRTDTDHYGRTISVCTQGDKDLNAWMVAEGWAVAYRQYSMDYVGEEDQAREARRGMWSGEFVRPENWRRGQRDGSTSDQSPRNVPDRDCGDFRTWQDAQSFYESAGPGDPHRLDGDRDGIACERLRR